MCDVSYFKLQGKFWYLATIEDLATRQILASRVGKHHDAALIISAIKPDPRPYGRGFKEGGVKQAILVTGHTPTYFHSDQGKEFMARATTDYLELQCSSFRFSKSISLAKRLQGIFLRPL